jgi:hypothetical protein
MEWTKIEEELAQTVYLAQNKAAALKAMQGTLKFGQTQPGKLIEGRMVQTQAGPAWEIVVHSQGKRVVYYLPL